jgi:hypothetical protein
MAAGPDTLAHDHALLPENYELRAETERLKRRVQQSLQSEDSASPQEGIEACSWHAPPDGPLFHTAIPPTYHAPAPLRQARRPLPPRPSRFGVR